MKGRLSKALFASTLMLGIFSSNAALAATTTPSNDPVSGVDLNKSFSQPLDKVDDNLNDNGIGNANNTGSGVGDNTGGSAGSVIKNVTGQRTHGEYQNNTNSCASCHQTHTAAAKELLFKDSVFDTCTACHDGTLGFYNVFQASTAGTFGGDANHNASMHLADGALTTSAAPGGNHTSKDEASWGKEFNCASCHSPHGSYSDRLLNYNPNDMGTRSSFDGGNAAWSKVYNYADIAGLQTTVQTAYDADKTYDPRKVYGKFILVRGTWTNFGLTAPTGVTSNEVIISYTFSVDHDKWTVGKALAPIIYGYEYYNPKKWYVTKLFALTDAELATDANNNKVPDKVDSLPKPYTTTEDPWVYDGNDASMHFDLQNGYIYADTDATLDAITYGQVARAYVVKMELHQYPGADLAANKANPNFALNGMFDYVSDKNLAFNNYGGVPIKYSNDQGLYKNGAGGKGIAMSQYCAACHTDYLANSGKATGTWDTTSYRHTTEADSYTCVRCHFAHGSDEFTMKDAQGRTYYDLTGGTTPLMTPSEADSWLQDKNTSSALKKFSNMSGCWSCHQNSHAEELINNVNGTDANRVTNGGWANEAPVAPLEPTP
jgi:predicted CXXCH cytochrome family protein